MDKTDRAAYKVLREHFASLCASGFDPSTAASELFAKKLINAALRDVTTRDISKNDKRKELVDGVMRCGRPGTFQTFLQILYTDDGYLAEKIRGERLDSVSACPPPPQVEGSAWSPASCAFIRVAAFLPHIPTLADAYQKETGKYCYS